MKNLEPLGDSRLQITGEVGGDTALFTCRFKDQDVTAEQLRGIASACLEMADDLDPDGSDQLESAKQNP